MAVTHEYLQARAAQDPVRLGKVMASEARVAAVRGDSIARKGWPFSLRVARDSIPEVTVLGDGTVAAVWAPFSTYEKARITGCGLAQFQLVKTRPGWRIASILVHQREACGGSEKK